MLCRKSSFCFTSSVCCADSFPRGEADCCSRSAGAESGICVASPFERLPPAGGRCRVSDRGRTRWHCEAMTERARPLPKQKRPIAKLRGAQITAPRSAESYKRVHFEPENLRAVLFERTRGRSNPSGCTLLSEKRCINHTIPRPKTQAKTQKLCKNHAPACKPGKSVVR